MASKKELQALIVLAGKIDPSLQKAINGAEKSTKGLNRTTQLLGNVATRTFDIMKKGAAIGAVGLGAAMVYVGQKGLMLASDLSEVQNVVDVTFGDNAKQVSDWSKTALKSFGLSELAAKQYTGTLGAMFKSSGISSKSLVTMSENLTGLAGDFSSFYNLKTDEAFDKIRAGIAGETEPLRALGIDMSVANLQAYALAKGITTSFDKMSAANKVTLRYNYLLEKSKDAQGDFARTSGSFANQVRLLGTNFDQLAGKLMDKTRPAFEKLFQKGNQLMDSFTNDPQKIAKFQNIMENVVDKVIGAIPTAIRLAKDFGSGILAVFNAAQKTYRFIRDNWSIIKPLIYGIVGAMAAWKTITIGMAIYEQTMKAIKLGTIAATIAHKMLMIAKMKDAAATAYLMALYSKDAIVKGASIASTLAMTAATTAWTVATTAATAVGTAFGAVIAFITSPIGLVILAIAALATGIYFLIKYWDTVTGAMSRAWQWFVNLIKKIPDLALVLAGPLAPLLLLIKYFDKIKSVAGGAVNSVKKFFGLGGNKKDSPPGGTSLPKFASGGFANRPSIFGEAGPEAAIPLKRTPRSLSLLNKTARMIGAGGGNSSSPQFIFAPVISGGNATEIESKLRGLSSDMFAQFDAWWESKRRESFG